MGNQQACIRPKDAKLAQNMFKVGLVMFPLLLSNSFVSVHIDINRKLLQVIHADNEVMPSRFSESLCLEETFAIRFDFK